MKNERTGGNMTDQDKIHKKRKLTLNPGWFWTADFNDSWTRVIIWSAPFTRPLWACPSVQ